MPPAFHHLRALPVALTCGVLLLPCRASGQQTPTRIPLTAGLALISTLQTAGSQGDREDVVVVDQVGPNGIRYRWTYREGEGGNGGQQGGFTRFVRSEDLEAAPRVNLVFASSDPERVPGATAFTLSRAALRELRAAGQTRLSYAEMDTELGSLIKGVGVGGTRVYYRGILSLVSPDPVALPLLLDGRRTAISVLHARGRFALRGRQIELDFFIVPDPEHPLLLKIAGGDATWQVLRVDLPGADAAGTIEHALEHDCRAEIPGVYFAFAAADVRRESAPALRAVTALLARHPAWTLAIEGHTDSVGSAATNMELSTRRAEAVRASLVTTFGVAEGRLSSRGLGATRPRETNATIEGRARNRRVELVRPCPATH